jgi:hypothetical protein
MKNSARQNKLGLRVLSRSTPLLAFLVLALTIIAGNVFSAEEYVYYGVIPGPIRFMGPVRELHGAIDPSAGWTLESEASSSLLSVIAYEDGTDVKVYTLPGNKLVSEATLGAMEKHYVELPNGTVFKVVTSKLATVMLLDTSMPNETTFEGPTPATYYPATDGSFFGKEFIFIASQGLAGSPYRILALEDAKVTIYKEDGSTFLSLSLKANEYKNIALSAFKGYKIVSTGYIAIQTSGLGWSTERSFFIPAVEGGFVGKTFYTASTETGDWDPIEDCGFRISSLEDTEVEIWNVKFRRLIETIKVKGGIGKSIYPKAEEIMIKSKKPISVAFIHNGSIARSYSWSYGSGVAFMGVKPNEETTFFAPTNATVYIYVFASEDTRVIIDDVEMMLKADDYFVMDVPGFHKILADKNVVIQIMHWPKFPPGQGIVGFGTIIPSVQTVNVTPGVKPAPLTTEGFPMTYVIAAAVVAVGAVVGVLVMKRRGKAKVG